MYDLTNIKKRNICIMGLMGSGKSIIGKDLGRYLKLKFYDTDKQIELKAKKNINAIFKEDGEKYFRDIEEKICIKLLEHRNCVISLGGGSIINTKIRKAIMQNSYSIYLKVKLDNLLSRIKTSHKRPLLNKKLNKREILQNLYYDRKEFYEKADLIVKNDNDKFITLEKIKSELKTYAK